MATIDSLQDSVNTLTSSTTTLLNEVNVSKATLTNSKDLAETAATSATTQAAAAASSASAASSSASSASASATAAANSAASASAIVTGVATGMPSVRPSLNLDFVNSKTVDPRISFTRSTTATYYDGKTTAKAEENLLKYSQEFDNAYWTLQEGSASANSVVAPDGTTTADRVTFSGTNGYVLKSNMGLVSGTTYTVSVWLKSTANITIPIGAGIQTTNVNVTTEWQRFTYTFTFSNAYNYIIFGGGSVLASGDVLDLWGAQLEIRDSVTAYTPTTTSPITNYIPVLQTAAINEPRLDHDPVTGEAKGLLIEESRTNYVTTSEDISAMSISSGTVVQTNVAIAPNGTQTADKLILADGATSKGEVRFATTLYSSKQMVSFYAKAGEETAVQITSWSDPGDYQNFDINLGILGSSGALTDSSLSRIEYVGNGWYRCSAYVKSSGGGFIGIHVVSGGNAPWDETQTGNGFGGIYVWGIQSENATFPTSYIPTSGASVTRGSEIGKMTGTNFSSWYRQDESTFYAEASEVGIGTSSNRHTIYGTADSANNTKINVGKATGGGSTNVVYVSESSSGTYLGAGVITANQIYKLASTFKTDDFTTSINGGTVSADTSGKMDSSSVTFSIGARPSGTNVANTHIRKIAYYPARLADSELQALTQS